ncbi:MAG: PAS domain-containing protein [Deltaproteobacteria bacterium]|nr:PAS domain-containing protein [Deltaproteobacteria bacterium]
MAYRCANDRDWTMTFVSDGALDLTGYAPAEFVTGSVTFASVMHPDDEPVVWEQIQSAIAQREPFRLAYRIRTRHGQERWCWEQGEGVYDADGAPIALEGFIVDITTERHALEAAHASRAYLATVLDSLTEAVCAIDRDGRVALLNPAGAEITGVAADEAIGRRPEELFAFVGPDGEPLSPSPFAAALRGRRRDAILDRRVASTCSPTRSASCATAAARGAPRAARCWWRGTSRSRRASRSSCVRRRRWRRSGASRAASRTTSTTS